MNETNSQLDEREDLTTTDERLQYFFNYVYDRYGIENAQYCIWNTYW